jgi:hypothetical protein
MIRVLMCVMGFLVGILMSLMLSLTAGTKTIINQVLHHPL